MLYDNLNTNFGFATFTFTDLQATGSVTTVEFQARNAIGADYLDDVFVTLPICTVDLSTRPAD